MELETFMELDNLELIKPLLEDNPDYFYVLTVMTRNKDLGLSAPERAQKHRVVKEYYIESIEYLERKYPEIKKLCQVFNARAYINLNRKNKKSLGLEIMSQTLEKLKSDSDNYLNIMSKSVGNLKTDSEYRRWILDIDCKDEEIINQYLSILDSVNPIGKSKYVAKIPTINGVHIISKPFDLADFAKKVERENLLRIDVQKNNPTLLYYYQGEINEKV